MASFLDLLLNGQGRSEPLSGREMLGSALLGFGSNLMQYQNYDTLGTQLGRAGQGVLQTLLSLRKERRLESKEDVEEARQRRMFELQEKRALMEMSEAEKARRREEDERAGFQRFVQKNAERLGDEGLKALALEPGIPAELLVKEYLQRNPGVRTFRPFTRPIGENELETGFYNPQQPQERVDVIRAPRYKPDTTVPDPDSEQRRRMTEQRNIFKAYTDAFPYDPLNKMRIDPTTGGPAPAFETFELKYKETGRLPFGLKGESVQVDKQAIVSDLERELNAGKIREERALEILKSHGISLEEARMLLRGK